MLMPRAKSHTWWRRPATLIVAALGVVAPSVAQAHFELQAPAAYSMQDGLGGPQKSPPCGQADPGQAVMTTGATTTYHQGQTIDITIAEKIYHPGHYRVSIAQDQNSLPADPVVTPGTSACGSTVVDNNPTLPLIADGLLEHSTSFSGPQTVSVTLPSNLTCTNCVLQVTEFMSEHGLNVPGGCWYHHCATVTILPSTDGGITPSVDASTPPTEPAGGCSCHVAPATAPVLSQAAGLFVFALLLRRRRRA